VGDLAEQVVAVRVGEVAGADLGGHVPAVERRGRVGDAADVQAHVADRRNGVPAQSEVGEPCVVGVAQRDLEHRVGGHLEPAWRARGVLPAAGHDQREDVEASRRCRREPPERTGRLGEPDVARVTDDLLGAVLGDRGVPGVAHELLVPDPGTRCVGGVGGQDGDRGPDASAAGRLAQVRDALGGHLVGCGDVTAVADVQAAPVEPTDAASGVAPGHAGAEGQLRAGVDVGAGTVDLLAHRGDAVLGRGGARRLGVHQAQELLRRVGVHRVLLGRSAGCSRGHPQGAQRRCRAWPHRRDRVVVDVGRGSWCHVTSVSRAGPPAGAPHTYRKLRPERISRSDQSCPRMPARLLRTTQQGPNGARGSTRPVPPSGPTVACTRRTTVALRGPCWPISGLFRSAGPSVRSSQDTVGGACPEGREVASPHGCRPPPDSGVALVGGGRPELRGVDGT